MGIGMGTALLVSTAVGAVGSVATGAKQAESQKEAEDEQQRLAQQAKLDEEEFLANQAKEKKELATPTVEFGTGNKDDTTGSFNDFLAPTQSSSKSGLNSGGGAKTSGLGFA